MSFNDQIRFNILEILYEDYFNNPGDIGKNKNEMQKSLALSENLLDSNILYLKEKGLIQLVSIIGSLWEFAKITAFGIDVVEQKERYREQFPFIMVQQIHGNVYGNVVQAKDSHVTIQEISKAFQEASSLTEAKTDIPPDLKKEVKETLLTLEEEVKKKEPDAGKIQKFWQWLKRNANWVVPSLTSIITDVIKSLY